MFSFERFLGLGEHASSFSVQLRCFSAPFFQKYDTQKINELNYGGKILLPNSCLDNLVRRHIQWPMLFKLTTLDPERQKTTHAGVLEFLAEEGKCYLPSWMMNQLGLIEGELIVVEYKSLPPATYAKFKPMSTDFYHVTNPKAMLEVELRKFACLTKGDVISVQYNDQIFDFKVMDLKPQVAVTIIECDINIEFDAAEGYVEPTRSAEVPDSTMGTQVDASGAVQTVGSNTEWKAFSGVGQRLDGKKARTTSLSTSGQQKLDEMPTSTSALKQISTGTSNNKGITYVDPIPIIPDENYNPGTLTFVRTKYKSKAVLEKLAKEKEDGNVDGIKPFSGKGQTIRG